MEWPSLGWWFFSFLLPWFVLFLLSGRRSFAAYYPGGLWSVALSIAIEYIMRRQGGFSLVVPRFVEGVLFYQLMPKQTGLQLPFALLGALGAVVPDMIANLFGRLDLNLQAAFVSLLGHLLRFVGLIAVFYALAYERRAERLGVIRRQEKVARISKALWKLSWIPLYFGVRAVVSRMERL